MVGQGQTANHFIGDLDSSKELDDSLRSVRLDRISESVCACPSLCRLKRKTYDSESWRRVVCRISE